MWDSPKGSGVAEAGDVGLGNGAALCAHNRKRWQELEGFVCIGTELQWAGALGLEGNMVCSTY